MINDAILHKVLRIRAPTNYCQALADDLVRMRIKSWNKKYLSHLWKKR